MRSRASWPSVVGRARIWSPTSYSCGKRRGKGAERQLFALGQRHLAEEPEPQCTDVCSVIVALQCGIDHLPISWERARSFAVVRDPGAVTTDQATPQRGTGDLHLNL